MHTESKGLGKDKIWPCHPLLSRKPKSEMTKEPQLKASRAEKTLSERIEKNIAFLKNGENIFY